MEQTTIDSKRSKVRYAIYFSGIFEYGYVQHSFTKRPSEFKLASISEALEFATKFRFKWVADLYCRLLEKQAAMNYDFRTFKVVGVPKKELIKQTA